MLLKSFKLKIFLNKLLVRENSSLSLLMTMESDINWFITKLLKICYTCTIICPCFIRILSDQFLFKTCLSKNMLIHLLY